MLVQLYFLDSFCKVIPFFKRAKAKVNYVSTTELTVFPLTILPVNSEPRTN